ncbi:MAG: exodeoxyribonuclease III, partial [Monoglobaceae bacterium]
MKKLISWNVNGLRACMGKGFDEIFKSLDADVFCLQEIKLKEGQIDYLPDGYNAYWNYAEKAGYSGTALFSKEKPLSVSYGIGIEKHDTEGRVITAEFEKFYVVT